MNKYSTDKKKATLYVYKGCNGLPSVDTKCLQILYYLRLNPNHSVRIKTSGISTSPILPALEYDGKYVTAQKNIFKLLEEMTGNQCDDKHESLMLSRIVAYKNLTYNIMEVVHNLNMWGYEENANHFIKMYGKEKYFPFRIVYARRMNSFTQNVLLDMCGAMTLKDHLIVRQPNVENFFGNLTILLRDSEYLLSDTPTSLDAYVCGYLAPLLILKFPIPHMQNVLKKYDTLCQYVKKFNDIYGDKDAFEEEPQPPDNDSASVGLIVCAGFFAFASMIAYGFINDIIKIK